VVTPRAVFVFAYIWPHSETQFYLLGFEFKPLVFR
jgi:hypothetical protein